MPLPTYPAAYPSTLGFTFGVPQAETGLSMESYEQTDTVDRYEQKDAFGQIIEVVLHNPRSEIVFSGQTTAAIASMLGQKITVSNIITNQVPTGGSTVCHQVHFTHGRAVNQTARVSATYYPLITGP
jgi:DeoR/GlpR family transcriptional regulator of sugar metabolism